MGRGGEGPPQIFWPRAVPGQLDIKGGSKKTKQRSTPGSLSEYHFSVSLSSSISNHYWAASPCVALDATYWERKCADTIGTVPVPWAGHFRC